MNILIIEDETIPALDIARTVKKAGHTAFIGYSYDDAMYLSNLHNNINLAIMDINLNGPKDGIDAVHEMRKKHKKLPIIYLTGELERAVEKKVHETKPIAFITKPFNRQDLLSALEKDF